jgi:hypothetical protein
VSDDERDELGLTSASRLDLSTFETFGKIAQRTSRRGLLVKLGRLSLAALGVSMFQELLPIGRDQAKAQVPCSGWTLCGFCGHQCGCPNCSGDNSQCPNCACIGGQWSQCCCINPSGCYNVTYADCWRKGDSVNGPCSSAKQSDCIACQWCCPGGSRGPYVGACPGTDNFNICTRVRVGSAC